MVTHLRMAWVVGGVVAAATVGGCASHSSGSHGTAPSSSATVGLTMAPGGAISPAGLAQASTPTSGGPSNVSSGAPGTQATATATIVVRPIDRGGHLAAGYSAVSEANTDSMVCDRSSVSLVAVDRGIFQCGNSADYGVACWLSASPSTVLCDRDPFANQVARIRVGFVAIGASVARPPVPFGLELDNGERCKVRNGGAWSRPEQQPTWVGYYECGSGAQDAVWAPTAAADTGGIDKSSPQWTVTVGAASGKGSLARHRVVTARFVGMAPSSTLPAVIWECTSPPPLGQQSTVKPTSIVIACADNGIGVDKLAWTNWTTTAAVGTGRVWENNCVPNCATGTIRSYPASITLSRVADTSEGPLFTHLTAVYHPVGPLGRTIGQFQLPSPPE